MKSRRFWIVVALGVGLLQIWDSGAFAVEAIARTFAVHASHWSLRLGSLP